MNGKILAACLATLALVAAVSAAPAAPSTRLDKALAEADAAFRAAAGDEAKKIGEDAKKAAESVADALTGKGAAGGGMMQTIMGILMAPINMIKNLFSGGKGASAAGASGAVGNAIAAAEKAVAKVARHRRDAPNAADAANNDAKKAEDAKKAADGAGNAKDGKDAAVGGGMMQKLMSILMAPFNMIASVFKGKGNSAAGAPGNSGNAPGQAVAAANANANAEKQAAKTTRRRREAPNAADANNDAKKTEDAKKAGDAAGNAIDGKAAGGGMMQTIMGILMAPINMIKNLFKGKGAAGAPGNSGNAPGQAVAAANANANADKKVRRRREVPHIAASEARLENALAEAEAAFRAAGADEAKKAGEEMKKVADGVANALEGKGGAGGGGMMQSIMNMLMAPINFIKSMLGGGKSVGNVAGIANDVAKVAAAAAGRR